MMLNGIIPFFWLNNSGNEFYLVIGWESLPG